MKYRVSLAPNARRDRDRIVVWYDAEAPDQTERFLDEFFAAARRLQDLPSSGSALRAGVRRVNLKLFPYQLWYRDDEETKSIEIIAVFHHRQDSTQFNRRLR